MLVLICSAISYTVELIVNSFNIRSIREKINTPSILFIAL